MAKRARRTRRSSNLFGKARRSRKSEKLTGLQVFVGIALVSAIPLLNGYPMATFVILCLEVALTALYLLGSRIVPNGRRERAERAEAARLAEQRQNLYEVGSSGTSGRELLLLTPTQFEEHVAEHYRQQGYTAEVTRKTGDQGLDVIADRDGERIGIQCKLLSGKAGNGAVQEAAAAKAHYKCSRVVVIATSGFTASAFELARSNRVQLIDGDQYQADLRRVKDEQESLARLMELEEPTGSSEPSLGRVLFWMRDRLLRRPRVDASGE